MRSNLYPGDIISIDFDPSVGHEPAKLRPAIVVSEYGFNSRSSSVFVVPITSTDNGYPLHVKVQGDAKGWACVEQMRSMDVESRGYTYIGYANDSTMFQITSLIRGIFGLR